MPCFNRNERTIQASLDKRLKLSVTNENNFKAIKKYFYQNACRYPVSRNCKILQNKISDKILPNKGNQTLKVTHIKQRVKKQNRHIYEF